MGASCHLASLFEQPEIMRRAVKSNLADGIAKIAESTDIPVTSNDKKCNDYVLDGGSLLYRIPYEKATMKLLKRRLHFWTKHKGP
jgi:hypothetical protein